MSEQPQRKGIDMDGKDERIDADKVEWAVNAFNASVRMWSLHPLKARASDMGYYLDVLFKDDVIATIHHHNQCSFIEGWRARDWVLSSERESTAADPTPVKTYHVVD